MANKETFKAKGTITDLGKMVQIERKNRNIPDLFKKVLTVEMDDGQVFYPEVRNQRLRNLDQQYLEVGCRAEIEFIFQGSEKNGKRYNNIYITSITRIS